MDELIESKVVENEPLDQHTTMRVGGPAKYFVEVTSKEELLAAVKYAETRSLKIFILGGGANTVFSEAGYRGLVIKMSIESLEIEDTLMTAGAGVNWEVAVEASVAAGLSGIEALSLIPGSVGAAPVQNIGAYGQQISQVLKRVEVLDLESGEFIHLSAADCELTYRDSIFKHLKELRYIIVGVELSLSEELNYLPPYYRDLEFYFEENGITEPTPREIRSGVLEIRRKKLPDPRVVPNSGSFFKNPIITAAQKTTIVDRYPELNNWVSKIFKTKSQAFWDQPDGTIKVAAGMLLEHSGYDNYSDPETGLGTWRTQTLTLINPKGANAKELQVLVDKITDDIKTRYGIELESEPEFIEA